MIKPELKIYFVFSLILIILFLLTVFLPFSREEKNKKISPTKFPTPAADEQSIVSPRIPFIKPTSTGANEEITQEIVDFASEKITLKKKTPLQEKDFFIEYDYSQDKFIVTLSSPKDQSKTNFEDWIKKNFPLIPIDRFSFK